MTVLLMPALTSFHITLPASATPTEVELEAASVPVKSNKVVLSLTATSTLWVVLALLRVLLSLISAPSWTSA